MKKSEILKNLENKFDYLPRREVERTLEKILQFFFHQILQKDQE